MKNYIFLKKKKCVKIELKNSNKPVLKKKQFDSETGDVKKTVEIDIKISQLDSDVKKISKKIKSLRNEEADILELIQDTQKVLDDADSPPPPP